MVLSPSHPKSYTRWHRRPKRITLAVQTSLYQAQTCVHTHTHRRVHTKRLPPQTPTDTQPHPSISVRMAGREPRVGGDARGLTVTQPHAMKHSPDHHHPTHRSTWNPQTHAHSVTAHTRTPPAPAPNTGTGLSTHMQYSILVETWAHIPQPSVSRVILPNRECLEMYLLGTREGVSQAIGGWKPEKLYRSPHYNEQSSPRYQRC